MTADANHQYLTDLYLTVHYGLAVIPGMIIAARGVEDLCVSLYIMLSTIVNLTDTMLSKMNPSTENQHSGSVGKERPLCDRGAFRFDPRQSHTKDFKNGTSCSFPRRSAFRIKAGNQNWSAQCQYNVTGWNIMSKCLGREIRWGGTLKVSTELPATSRHRRDMTERLFNIKPD